MKICGRWPGNISALEDVDAHRMCEMLLLNIEGIDLSLPRLQAVSDMHSIHPIPTLLANHETL